MQVGSIPAEERAKIKGIIDAGLGDKAAISEDMFDVVQKVVFKEMYHNTFQRFVIASEYSQMHADIKNAYNKVGANVFIRRWSGFCIDTACTVSRTTSTDRFLPAQTAYPACVRWPQA